MNKKRLVSLLSLLVFFLAACSELPQTPTSEVQRFPEGCTRSWPLVQKSPSYSRNAKVVQYLLREDYFALTGGYNLTADGYFGQVTFDEVSFFQRIIGLDDDGKVGRNTWETLAGGTVSFGARGEEVRAVQTLVDVSVDGIFGPLTRDAVANFQRGKGLSANGEVDVNTWAALVGGKGCP